MKIYNFNSEFGNKALTFDDITLLPQFSEIESRKDAITNSNFFGLKLKTPIISAAMDTITEKEMCIALRRVGALGCLHRFMSIERNLEEYKAVKQEDAECIVSIGTKKEEMERFEALYDAGARYFSIDIAHGHSIMMKNMLTRIKEQKKDINCIIAGNVATEKGAKDLADWGANVIKVGVSAGAVCTTRIKTAHGVPQFSAIWECSKKIKRIGSKKIIADGGIRSSGDIIKSFAAGADYVMLGSLLAGTYETPGEIINNKKAYRGMSSKEAIAFAKSGSDFHPAAEGISTEVPIKGYVEDVINELTLGLKSGMTYCNASGVDLIRLSAKWVKQSFAGCLEGQPHIYK